jgi:HAD-hyrolase-like
LATVLILVLSLLSFLGVWVLIVDIRGANEFGWYSVLVRTGNFKGEGNSPKYPARKVFDDVELAVNWIVDHEDTRLQNLMTAKETGKDDEGYYSE